MRDSNPRPPRCKRASDDSEGNEEKHVTSPASPVCTRVCTSEAETDNAGGLDGHQGEHLPTADDRPNAAPDRHQGGKGEGTDQDEAGRGSSATEGDQGDPLAKLAATLLTLSPVDRERLAAMLAEHQGKGERAKP